MLRVHFRGPIPHYMRLNNRWSHDLQIKSCVAQPTARPSISPPPNVYVPKKKKKKKKKKKLQ